MSEKTYAIFDTPANRKIIGDLRESGARLIIFPPLAAERIVTNEAVENLSDLKRFDWLIFADVLAVECFLERLVETGFDLYELDDLRVCALGEAVSDALRFASLHADVVPAKTDAPTAFSALVEYVGAAELGGLRLLCLSGEAFESELTKRLRNENVEVVESPIYRVLPNENGELAKLKTLLRGGAIDEFILSAPTDLIWLKHYFKPADLADIFAEVTVAAADGVTFQTARECDFPRIGLFRLDNVVKVN